MSEHKLKLSKEVRAENRARFERVKTLRIPAPKIYMLPKKTNKKKNG
jgi:hypothetical protein